MCSGSRKPSNGEGRGATVGEGELKQAIIDTTSGNMGSTFQMSAHKRYRRIQRLPSEGQIQTWMFGLQNNISVLSSISRQIITFIHGGSRVSINICSSLNRHETEQHDAFTTYQRELIIQRMRQGASASRRRKQD